MVRRARRELVSTRERRGNPRQRTGADGQHGGQGRSSLPQHPRRRGDRDRRARVHVRGRGGAVRSSPRLPRHGRRHRDHMPLLLHAVPPRSHPRPACGATARVRAGGWDDRLVRRRRHGTVASSRRVIIAGAGIGGLTAALALAQRGFRRRCVRPGATSGRGRRGPAAFAQCLARSARPRPRPAVAAPRGRSGGASGPGREDGAGAGAGAFRRDRGRALRRALLGHPSRRPANRAAGIGARASGYQR